MSGFARYPWRRAARFALFAFAVLSLLPVWHVWHFGSWEANGKPASFWTMLMSLPRALDHCSASELVLDYYGPHLILPAALLGGILLVGRWWAGRPRGVSVSLNPWSARVLALCLLLLAVSLLTILGR